MQIDQLKPNVIVHGAIFPEPVQVIVVVPMGNSVKLIGKGLTTGKVHEPILNAALFEAVQAKLAAQAVARRCRLRGSPAILSGRLFDNRGNRMSPTHANKGGARYRYYVSPRRCCRGSPCRPD